MGWAGIEAGQGEHVLAGSLVVDLICSGLIWRRSSKKNRTKVQKSEELRSMQDVDVAVVR